MAVLGERVRYPCGLFHLGRLAINLETYYLSFVYFSILALICYWFVVGCYFFIWWMEIIETIILFLIPMYRGNGYCRAFLLSFCWRYQCCSWDEILLEVRIHEIYLEILLIAPQFIYSNRNQNLSWNLYRLNVNVMSLRRIFYDWIHLISHYLENFCVSCLWMNKYFLCHALNRFHEGHFR